MQRVSLRTLVLMVELLLAIIALQYITLAGPAQADAVWLASEGIAPVSAPAVDINSPMIL
ncbi:MAG: hypothetical protein FJ280_04150 [Planctomycetes bacterium]|nr:hypothetical protein [Planctomycetota bacterium]